MIQAHKENCTYCQRQERERREAIELKYAGARRLGYIIHQFQISIRDIDRYEYLKKEADEKQAKGEKFDGELEYKLSQAHHDFLSAQSRIELERLELHRLLWHDGPIIRESAAKEFLDKNCWVYFNRYVKKVLGKDKDLLYHPKYHKEEVEKVNRWLHPERYPPYSW